MAVFLSGRTIYVRYLIQNLNISTGYLAKFSSSSALDSSDIHFEELKEKLLKNEIHLIDVREPKELKELGCIPGSFNVPLRNLANLMLLPEDEFKTQTGFFKFELDVPLATMCMAGVRAQTAYYALKGFGYSNVRRYEGSFEDWVDKGGELDFPSVVLKPDIEYSELKEKLEKKEIVLIDCRAHEKFVEDGHIPGSINISLNTLGDVLMLEKKQFLDKLGCGKPKLNFPVVTMCLKGIASRTAQLALLGYGFTNVRMYYGSLEDWKKKGDIIEH